MAVEDKLIEMSISEQIEGNTGPSYLEELKQLYQKVMNWVNSSCYNVVTYILYSTSVVQGRSF